MHACPGILGPRGMEPNPAFLAVRDTDFKKPPVAVNPPGSGVEGGGGRGNVSHQVGITQ